MKDETLHRNTSELLRARGPALEPSPEFLSRLDRAAAGPRRDRLGFLPLALIAAVVLAALCVWVLREAAPDDEGRMTQEAPHRPAAVLRLGPDRLHHDARVRKVVFVDAHTVASGANGDSIRFWDVATGREKRRFDRDARRLTGAFDLSPDRRQLAVGCDDGSVRLWDVATGAETAQLRTHESFVGDVAYSPDGKHLASGGPDKRLIVWDLATRGVAREFATEGDVRDIRFAKGGALVLCAGTTDINAWEVATGAVAFKLNGNANVTLGMALSANERTLLTLDGVRINRVARMRLWDIGDPAHGRHREILVEGVSPLCAAVSRDGGRIVIGGFESVRAQDVATNAVLWEFTASYVSSIALSPDESHVAIAADSEVRLLGAGGQSRFEGAGTGGQVSGLAISEDQRFVAATTNGRVIRVWDLATGKEAWRTAIVGDVGRLRPVFVADRLAVHDGECARVFDAAGRERRVFAKAPPGTDSEPVCDVAAVDNGRRLALMHYAGTISIWDPASGERAVPDATGHANPEGLLGLAAHGDRLAVANLRLRILDARTGAEIAESAVQSDPLMAVAFSPDGSLVVTGGPPQLVIWRASDATPLLTIRVAAPQIISVAFSPDGALVTCGNVAEPVQVWETATGRAVAALPKCAAVVAFAKDGRLVTGHKDGSVTFWDLRCPDEGPAASLEQLWAALAGDDAPAAHTAVNRLAARGDEAVKFLAGKWREAPRPPARLVGLIAKLESEGIEDRVAAERALAAEDSEAALRARLAEGAPAESRARIESLLARMERPPYVVPAALQRVRAVQALALMPGDTARRALESLAKDAPHAAVRARAAAALR